MLAHIISKVHRHEYYWVNFVQKTHIQEQQTKILKSEK